MKNKSVIALMLAFTMCFTSVCPALAAENTAVESEEVNESNPEEVSEENAAPAEETASVTQEAAEADEEMNDASSDKQEEPVEVEEAADVTEQNTGVTADAAEENEDIYDEAADTAVAEAATEEYSKKAGEAAAEPEFAPVSGNEEGQTVVPGNSGDDSPEDLFEKYMSVEFGLSDNSSMRKSKKITGTRLEGNDLAVYREVAKELPAIAEGVRASTVFELTPEVFGYEKTEWTAEELGVASIYEADGTVSKQASAAALAKTAYDLDKVTTALLADFPFELYWFDKTAGCSAPYSWYTKFVDGEYVFGITNISIRFSVAGEFSGSDAYTVKTDIGQSLQDAVNNVNTIIEQYSGASDEDKLLRYKEEICERVSYNDDAAAGNFDFNYGNPWQLLWVFDNDVETNVVCEGYSKAFKHLCDQSSFDSNITCILVSGTMYGGTGEGPHMWNIVKKGDGLNYLVDVTNCDDGSIGSPDKLFLVRTEDLDTNGEIETGYTFHFDGRSVAYSYDEDTLNYYNQNEISLGELQHVHDLIKTEAKDATCTEAGNIEYWTCSECEKLFSDEEGTTEITAADTVVPAKGHSLEKTEAKEATCTEAGNTEYWTCSECKKLFGDDQGTREITAADTVVAATGHDWGEWTVVKEATEEEEGLERRTCSNDESHTEEKTIPKLNHVHNLVKTDAVDASCTEAGNIDYWICSECKKLFSDAAGTTEITAADTVVAAKGHSLEKTEAKAATCTEAGNTEYWTCSECEKLFSDEEGTTEITAADTVVAAKGHSLEKTEAVDATCTEAGNIEYWTCSKCNKLYKDSEGTQEITEADTAVAAKGHNWTEWTVVTKATEEKEGLETRTCLNDESHKEERTIPKLQGKWKKNNKGWWYVRSDGSYPAGEFETIKGKTYYFNESGYMLTGWQKISGEWYYFSAGGAMLTDWQKINDKWYYFSASGAMQTDWQNINGTWYYFSAGGAMQTGWQKINGTWYYFSAGGAMQTGWQKIDGKWYYFGAGGAMQTGWQQINGTWYYMEASGAMAANKWVGDYYLTGSGAMAKNTWIGNYYVGADGKWIPGYKK